MVGGRDRASQLQLLGPEGPTVLHPDQRHREEGAFAAVGTKASHHHHVGSDTSAQGSRHLGGAPEALGDRGAHEGEGGVRLFAKALMDALDDGCCSPFQVDFSRWGLERQESHRQGGRAASEESERDAQGKEQEQEGHEAEEEEGASLSPVLRMVFAASVSSVVDPVSSVVDLVSSVTDPAPSVSGFAAAVAGPALVDQKARPRAFSTASSNSGSGSKRQRRTSVTEESG